MNIAAIPKPSAIKIPLMIPINGTITKLINATKATKLNSNTIDNFFADIFCFR